MTIAFNVHGFLKNRISKSAPFSPKTFVNYMYLRSITIISPLRLYITITNTITPCTLYFKCTTQYYTLVLSYKFKYDSHITMITVQCTCTCGTIVHVLFRSTSF